MKIISKFKDYYDYLQGIYGIDEKLILNRTEFTQLFQFPEDYTVARIYFCGWYIEGLWLKNQVLYGKQLEKLAVDKYLYGKEANAYYAIPTQDSYVSVRKRPIRDHSNTNNQYECAILIMENRGYGSSLKKNPILKEYNFSKVFPPKQAWIALSEWLGSRRSLEPPNTQSNENKILSHGFDLKTSFRKPKQIKT